MHAAETRPHPSASPRPEQAVFVIRSRFPWRQLAPHACDPPLDGIIAATEAVSFEWAGLLCIPRQQSRILPFCSSFLRGSTFPHASSLHSAVRSPDTPGGGVPSGSLASITQRSVPLPPPSSQVALSDTDVFCSSIRVFSPPPVGEIRPERHVHACDASLGIDPSSVAGASLSHPAAITASIAVAAVQTRLVLLDANNSGALMELYVNN